MYTTNERGLGLTAYAFRDLDYRKVWRDLKSDRRKPYHLRSVSEELGCTVQGDAVGLRRLAIHFLVVAARGGHTHLESQDVVRYGWVLEAGPGLDIHDLGPLGPGGGPRPGSFEYESAPVIGSVSRNLPADSECKIVRDDTVAIAGDVAALVSLAEHCLDLADPGTPVGTKISYAPLVQLADDSLSFAIVRISSA